MHLNRDHARLFVPDRQPEPAALARTTHLGIGAHQDDLEFMAFHGILACFHAPDRWFGGVTCTNGAGSPRAGAYAGYSDAEMQAVRRREQEKAAAVGEYSFMLQLGHPSATVKDPRDREVAEDLAAVLEATRPEVVYTHNPADKHDTHIGVVAAVIQAVRALPPAHRPARILGCEVWRDLDWLADEDKVVLVVDDRPNLAAALNGVFDSQIAGGKRYDLAVAARRTAHATFFESHATDQARQVTFAMDLSPLARDDALSPADLVSTHIERFRADVQQRLARRLGPDKP
jgi:LmbE family N-acetylglucosaminyl deacetylase